MDPATPNLDALASHLFGQLRAAMERRRPGIGAAWNKAGINLQDQKAIEEWLSANLGSEPLEPWNSLISGMFGLRLSLSHLQYIADTLETTEDRRTQTFLMSMAPVAAYSCFEGLMFLVSIAGRQLDSNFREETKLLLEAIKAERDNDDIANIRHQTAHGVHTSIRADGWLTGAFWTFWLDGVRRDSLWATQALSGEFMTGSLGKYLDQGTVSKRTATAYNESVIGMLDEHAGALLNLMSQELG